MYKKVHLITKIHASILLIPFCVVIQFHIYKHEGNGSWMLGGARLSHAEAQAFKVVFGNLDYSRSSGNYNLELRQSPTSTPVTHQEMEWVTYVFGGGGIFFFWLVIIQPFVFLSLLYIATDSLISNLVIIKC